MAERFDLNQLRLPIVQAPMAGGPSTPELAIAVCEAGGLGFLAAGYRTVEDVRAEVAAVRAGTAAPFGVNVFVPGPPTAERAALDAYVRELGRKGVPGEPRHDEDEWDAKLGLLRAGPVAVVSFTFGCPSAETVAGLQRAGTAVWVTVTSPAEAAAAHAAGADALVVQGSEAGGHRAAFTDDDDAGGVGLIALLRLVAGAVPLPLVATGGIADGAAVAAALAAGASAAQIGTALMLTPEAGTDPAQRAVLAEPSPTRLTRAFTGRLARGIVNRFLLEHPDAPRAYPEIHHATRPLRAAARASGDAGGFNLWAGQAHELARARPAAQIVAEMADDARAALQRALQSTGR